MSTRTKTRSLFLAALMVVSVLAMTTPIVPQQVQIADNAEAITYDQTIYVNVSLGTNGDGTQSNPYQDIQSAIDDAEGGAPESQTGSGLAGTGDNVLVIVKGDNGPSAPVDAEDDGDSTLVMDAARTGELTIRAENGSDAITLDAGNTSTGELLSVSAAANVTIDNFTLVGNSATDIINVDSGINRGQRVTVENSVLDIHDSGTDDVAGIKSGSAIVVARNNVFQNTTGGASEAMGVWVFNSKTDDSHIEGNTFDRLDVGVNSGDSSNLTVIDNSFSKIQDEAVVIGSTSGGADVTSAFVERNNFTGVGQGVYFTENGGTINNASARDLLVRHNNFPAQNNMGGTPAIDFAIGTDSDGDFDGGGAITGTIVAEENYYGTAAGPEVDTDNSDGAAFAQDANRDQGNYEIQGSKTDTTDDISYGNWLDAPYPGNETTLNFDIDNVVNQQAPDQKVRLNVTIPAHNGTNVDEGSITLRTVNDAVGDRVTLVENGVVNTSAETEVTEVSSTLDGNNDSVEFIKLNVSLKEDQIDDGTDLDLFANDTSGQRIPDTDPQTMAAGTVNMSGAKFKVRPDASNPFVDDGSTPLVFDEIANVTVVIADKFGHNLTDTGADTADNGIPDIGDIGLSANDGSVTIEGPFDTFTGSTTANSGVETEPARFNVTNTEAETITLEAFDDGTLGGTVSSGKAKQTFSPRIGGIIVTSNKSSINADSTDRAGITAQLTDGSGTNVTKSGVNINFIFENDTAAGVTVTGSSSANTDSSGQATTSFTADTLGETVTVTARETSTSTQWSNSTKVDTVAGQIDNTTSDFEINGNGQPNDLTTADGVKVGTQHLLNVVLQDTNNNPVEGASVTLSSNNSATTFGSTSLTTNASGQANTMVTLPDTKGTVAINMSAGDMSASLTGDARINVTTIAENATALQFGSASRAVASGTTTEVTVEAVDEFGNVNTSWSTDIVLESSDETVIDFGAGQDSSTNSSLVNGAATFTAEANASSGSATLEANSSGISNVSDTWAIGTPASADVWFDSDVSTSSNAVQTTTVYAQLLDDNGDALSIRNENITFTLEGDSAELNQNQPDFVNNTNATGVAQFQVNATSTTGDSTVQVFSENYTLSTSTETITTTGKATTVVVTPETSSAETNTSVNVTVHYADSQGRMVPKTTQLTVQSDLTDSFLDSGDSTPRSTKTRPVLRRNSGANSTVSINSTSAGTATLNAFGGGTSGSGTVTFTSPTAATGSVTFDDKTVANNSASITVDNANASVDYYVNVSEGGTVIGHSDDITAGTNDSVTVSLDQNITEDTTLTATVHDASDDSQLASDDAEINVSESVVDQYDTNGQAGIQSTELLDAISDFRAGTLSSTDLLDLIDSWRSSN